MRNDIISMYINLIIKPIERQFIKNKFKNKKEKKEFDSLYMKALLAIEDEINDCIKKRS